MNLAQLCERLETGHSVDAEGTAASWIVAVDFEQLLNLSDLQAPKASRFFPWTLSGSFSMRPTPSPDPWLSWVEHGLRHKSFVCRIRGLMSVSLC